RARLHRARLHRARLHRARLHRARLHRARLHRVSRRLACLALGPWAVDAHAGNGVDTTSAELLSVSTRFT
ncbi:pentapeptide repeat-containing protein, partial [Rhizocola hellebori]|uniref:pentapeptide repeat-containing protein n=1 Tax=Rhizocola hellebori TaxID=1392758 RepID=UPI003571654A